MDSVPDDLKPLSSFLFGSGNHRLSPLQLHLVRRWRPATLASYNSAVKRFINFYRARSDRPFSLPASDEDIYAFCLSVGRTREGPPDNRVTAKTLAKYLYALQAWHLFHQQPYPSNSREVVTVMLRSSAHVDASTPLRPAKTAVMIHHVLALYNALNQGDSRDQAILDCAVCAFWGMARLAELTDDQPTSQPDRLTAVLGEDAVGPIDELSHVYLTVRGTKTAKPGVAQPILLNQQPNKLCPVKAVLRRLRYLRDPADSLFGYIGGDGARVNLTRRAVVTRCQQVWREHGWNSITGHSFRVGGASLRAALGVSHDDIKQLGRWTSDCYKLYIREYSERDLQTTLSILQALTER